MNHYDEMERHDDDLKHKAYEKLEHMFLMTPHGQRYKSEHQQLEHERKSLERRYRDFREKMKHEFSEYLMAM